MPMGIQSADPYAKYGGSVSDDSSMEQPNASVRAPSVKVGDYYPINGQDAYVSGFDSKNRPMLSPGKPPASAQSSADPYAKYGGNVADASDSYGKYNDNPALPPMNRAQADNYMTQVTTRGMGQYRPPQQPKFGDVALVDPEAPEYGGPIKSSIHADTRGGKNLVPVQDVAATRQQLQYQAANPGEMAQVQRSQQMDTNLPFAQRMAARSGLEVRKRTELGEATSAANDRWKAFAGQYGGDKGEALIDFMAKEFQDDGKATPGEKGFARSIGKNIATTLADPVTYALPTLGAAGKVGQVALSSLFAAGAAKGSYDAAGQLGSIWDRSDISSKDKTELATDLFLNTAMAGMAGAHAVKVPFLKSGDPLLSSIPQQYRDAVTQKVNATISKTGGILTRTAGTIADVAAEVGNSDRENVPTQGVSILRRSLPKVPQASAETALPLVRAVADEHGATKITAEDLLNSAPDKDTGAVSPGLISEAKKAVIAKAGELAGPGKTISDLTPEQLRPFNRQLDALDDLHDHIQAAQEKETADLKAAANKGKIPESAAQAIGRIATGGGKYALARTVGAAIPFGGPMTRAGLNAAGIGGGFGDLVSGVKYFIGQGGKLSPTLDENLNTAFSSSKPQGSGLYESGETRGTPTPYQGDTSVRHETNIYPPETPHGDAAVIPDVPNPRFQMSSSGTTDPYARYGGKATAQPANGAQSFTSVPKGVTPQEEPRQLNLAPVQPKGNNTSDVIRVGSPIDQAKAKFNEQRTAAESPDVQPASKPVGAAAQAKANFEAQRAQAVGQAPDWQRDAQLKIQRGSIPDRPLSTSEMKGYLGIPESVGPKDVEAAGLVKRNAAGLWEVQKTGDAGDAGNVFPNDKAMEDWLNNQYERSPRIQKIKDLVKERIQQGDLPPGIRPSADELARMNSRIQSMIYETNGQGIDTPAQLDRIDQWIRATNKPPKPFQPGQPLKTRPAPTQAALPAGDNGYTGPDRRQAMDYRAQVEAMKPEEQAKAIFFSEKTGLPNYRAFQQSEQLLSKTHPIVGYADVDDFKNANTALGKEAVDTKILPMMGELFKEAAQDEPGVHVFHRSGDEFLFRVDDPAAVTRVVNRVNEQLQGAKFTAQRADGSIAEHTGTGLSKGTGDTEDAAELAAEEDKQQRKLQGLRTGARDAPEKTPDASNANANVPSQSGQRGAAPESEVTKRQGLLSRASDLKPNEYGVVPTKDLNTDPTRFQYKGGTDEQGVTNALKDQKVYDPHKGGVLLVWKDPANGRVFVVNGHHRFELAQRAGQENVLVHMIDAPDAESAKVIGAETNISEGHGSIVDAARFFKAARISNTQDAMNRNLPLGQAMVKNGLAMARLDDSIIDRVESGKIPEGRAVAIGSVTDNPAQQDAVLQAIAKAESRAGRELNNGEVDSIARQVKASSTRIEQGADLFGSFQREQSLYGEQAAIDDYILKQLSSDKRTFGAVSSKNRADLLGKVEGQSINAGENQKLSEQAAQATEIYKRLINSPGALNDIRTDAAKALASRYSKPQDVKAKAYERIRQELMSQISSTNGASEGKRP